MSDNQSNPIVVLGARVVQGRPSPMLESRLALAVDMYRVCPRPVVVTGRGEAEIMAGWLAHHGVALEHIVIEPDATSTNENLEKSWALFPEATLLTVVTSAFHVARTRIWAWHLSIPVEVSGAPMPSGSPARKARNYSREVIAVPHSLARVVWRRALHMAQGLR